MKITVEVPVMFSGDIGRKKDRTIIASIPRDYDIPFFRGDEVSPLLSFLKRDTSRQTDEENAPTRVDYVRVGDEMAVMTRTRLEAGSRLVCQFPRYVSDSTYHPLFSPTIKAIHERIHSYSKTNHRFIKSELMPPEFSELMEPFRSSVGRPSQLEIVPLSQMDVRQDKQVIDSIEAKLKSFDTFMSHFICINGFIANLVAEPVIISQLTYSFVQRPPHHTIIERPIGQKVHLVGDAESVSNIWDGLDVVSIPDFDTASLADSQSNFDALEVYDTTAFRLSTSALSAARNSELARRRFLSALSSRSPSSADYSGLGVLFDRLSQEDFSLYKKLARVLETLDGTDLSDEFVDLLLEISTRPSDDITLNNAPMKKALSALESWENSQIAIPMVGVPRSSPY